MFFVNADFFILIGNRNFLYQLGHPLHFLCIGYHCLLKNNQLSKKLKSPKQSFGRKFDAKVAKIVDKSPNMAKLFYCSCMSHAFVLATILLHHHLHMRDWKARAWRKKVWNWFQGFATGVKTFKIIHIFVRSQTINCIALTFKLRP